MFGVSVLCTPDSGTFSLHYFTVSDNNCKQIACLGEETAGAASTWTMNNFENLRLSIIDLTHVEDKMTPTFDSSLSFSVTIHSCMNDRENETRKHSLRALFPVMKSLHDYEIGLDT